MSDVKREVAFYKHGLDEECIAGVGEAAKNVFITLGPKTQEFERKFADYLSLPEAVGVMSCTHALHLSYVALGIGPGDEVIVPAFTFAATVAAVLHSGATPVFADVDPLTGILDPIKTEAAITPRTKAICPVHLYGVMAPMRDFRRIADRRGVLLIEDAAHCIEGRGPDFSPGGLSDAVAFSFYATKNITCGEGGALATHRKELADKVRMLRNHGMDKSAAVRDQQKSAGYDITRLGYKSNLNDLLAAMLIPQLRRIEERWARRDAIAQQYQKGLEGIKGIAVSYVPPGYKSAWHLYTVRVAGKRDEFLNALKDAGVGCSVNYHPLSELTFFREKLGMRGEDFPSATAIGNSTITLPMYPSLNDDEVEYVVQSVRRIAARMFR